RHVRHAFKHSLDSRKVVRLMKRRQRRQFVEFGQNAPRHDSWTGEARSTVNDAVADPKHTRPAVLRSEPGGQSFEGITPIADQVQLFVGQASTARVFDRQSGRSTDALDLASRFQPPDWPAGPLEDAELQT